MRDRHFEELIAKAVFNDVINAVIISWL